MSVFLASVKSLNRFEYVSGIVGIAGKLCALADERLHEDLGEPR